MVLYNFRHFLRIDWRLVLGDLDKGREMGGGKLGAREGVTGGGSKLKIDKALLSHK
jgi:hypothetical protein